MRRAGGRTARSRTAPRPPPNSSPSRIAARRARRACAAHARRAPCRSRFRRSPAAVRTCGAKRLTASNSSCIAGLRPIMPQKANVLATSASTCSNRSRRSMLLRTPVNSPPRRVEIERLADVVERPSFTASMAVSTLAWPVIRMIWHVGSMSRMARSTSSPLMSGILRSTITASGLSTGSSARAARASVRVTTVNPKRWANRSTIANTPGSSSITSSAAAYSS